MTSFIVFAVCSAYEYLYITQSECPDSSDEVSCPSSCNFENGFCSWSNALSNNLNWVIQNAATSSGGTNGPSSDNQGGKGKSIKVLLLSASELYLQYTLTEESLFFG